MSIASISGRTKRPGRQERVGDSPSLMGVVSALQTALDLQELLGIFSREVDRFVPAASFAYRHPLRALCFAAGSGAGRHTCDYRLTLGNVFLGELEFRRERRFSIKELEWLETLLALFVHPLRNALLYLDAVNAAASDPLTGLGNRRGLEAALDKEIERARRYGQGFSLLLLDLDHFKQVNDAHGHLGGDTALVQFAALMERLMRDCDWVFRFGGEEFAALLPNTSLTGAEQLAERLRAETAALPIHYNGRRILLTISVGVAAFHLSDGRMELMERADRALYQAKGAGRNQVVAASEPAERHEVG